MDEQLVEPGYEAVRDAFVRGAATLGRGGGAYCAYVDGKPVVDLWAGSAHPGRPWQRGTTTVIMSATKGLVAMCVQQLVDRGRLDLDERVSTYWPEYAQNGKESTLVRHVMMHTAGVLGYAGQTDQMLADGTGWDDVDAIAAGLAAEPPLWEPGSKHCYHALSFGWLAGEIVRRVDGRTVGQYFADEIAGPLGLEAWIGTPESELHRVAHLHPTRTERMFPLVRKGYQASIAHMRDPESYAGKAFLGSGPRSAVDDLEEIFNNPKVLRGEVPAGNGTANARALARVWAMQANDGELDGVRLLSPESVEAWGRIASNLPDLMMSEVPLPRMLADKETPVPRTFGHLGNGPMPGLGHRFGPNPDAFGAEGLGGQFGFCDRDARIAVGYVRSDLALVDVLQPTVTRELYRCAQQLGHDVTVAPSVSRVSGALVRRLMATKA